MNAALHVIGKPYAIQGVLHLFLCLRFAHAIEEAEENELIQNRHVPLEQSVLWKNAEPSLQLTDVADIDVDDLKEVLTLMGDAPVLADGTQMGNAFTGGVDQYKTDLLKARDILQKAYEFDATNTANW